MKTLFFGFMNARGAGWVSRGLGLATILGCFGSISCAKLAELARDPASEQPQPAEIAPPAGRVSKPNRTAPASPKIAPDVALFDSAAALAQSSNSGSDNSKAILSFKRLILEYPHSPLTVQAKAWIQVLEQQQKLNEEKQRVAEEKRILAREREALLHERQKLNYVNERSRQLDLEIEKRRRQSLSK